MAGIRRGYEPIPLPSLDGGLNLQLDADVAPNQAIDALNVTYINGAIRQRDGYDNLTAALTNAGSTITPYYRTGAAAQLVVGAGTRVEAIATDGTVNASSTGHTTGTWGFARFGQPGVEAVYFGQGSTNLNKLVATTFTTNIANTPEAGALAVMPVSNRLVAGRFNNTTGGPDGSASSSSPSHVYFSDPGTPETWTTTNFIQITPGDGEAVQAIVAWREFVFIFKETKFAVVTSESQDSGGDPIFNYRVVEAGVGALGPKAVCAGTDGVYFASRSGIYRTTGDAANPVLISENIAPIFDSSSPASGYYQGGVMLQSQAANTALWWHNDRLYVGFTITSTSNTRTLEYDPQRGWWTLHDIPAACGISFRRSSSPELTFCDTTNKKVYFQNSTHTNDDGTAITSRWRQGWTDLGIPVPKTSRAQVFWGDGIVEADIATDYKQGSNSRTIDMTNPAATSGNWGDSDGTWGSAPGEFWGNQTPGSTERQRRTAANGTVFSLVLRNSTLDRDWRLNRVTHLVRPPRRAAAETE